jgi:hypothetical protein
MALVATFMACSCVAGYSRVQYTTNETVEICKFILSDDGIYYISEGGDDDDELTLEPKCRDERDSCRYSLQGAMLITKDVLAFPVHQTDSS